MAWLIGSHTPNEHFRGGQNLSRLSRRHPHDTRKQVSLLARKKERQGLMGKGKKIIGSGGGGGGGGCTVFGGGGEGDLEDSRGKREHHQKEGRLRSSLRGGEPGGRGVTST